MFPKLKEDAEYGRFAFDIFALVWPPPFSTHFKPHANLFLGPLDSRLFGDKPRTVGSSSLEVPGIDPD